MIFDATFFSQCSLHNVSRYICSFIIIIAKKFAAAFRSPKCITFHLRFPSGMKNDSISCALSFTTIDECTNVDMRTYYLVIVIMRLTLQESVIRATMIVLGFHGKESLQNLDGSKGQDIDNRQVNSFYHSDQTI